MMPAWLTMPTEGLMPTMPFIDDGHWMEPAVSVPTARSVRLAATLAPEPELDPHAVRSSAYGFFTMPPRALHPEMEWLLRMFAHSLRLAFPSRTAPAARSLSTTTASFGWGASRSTTDPAVVFMRSPVSMLSFSTTGTPCSGPRTLPCLRSSSREAAIASASGFTSRIERSSGPCLSRRSIRARYAATSARDVHAPDAIFAWASSTVSSSRSASVGSSTRRVGRASEGVATRARPAVTKARRSRRIRRAYLGRRTIDDEGVSHDNHALAHSCGLLRGHA
jgi:hypothetical protein